MKNNESKSEPRVSDSNRACDEFRGKGIDCTGVDEEIELRVCEMNSQNMPPRGFSSKSSDHDGGSDQSGSWKKEDGDSSRGKGVVEVNFGGSGEMEDSGSRSRKGDVEFGVDGRGRGVRAGPSGPEVYGYKVGDMVWAKVKSHPWWPGHIYSEACASSSVRRTKRGGHLLVAFFGDSSYGWFDRVDVIPFAPKFAEKSKQTNTKSFVKAVEEAIDEIKRRCGLGVVCRCRNKDNFRPTNIKGYFSVDVADSEPGAVYSASQIRKARACFQPRKSLDFVKHLALSPIADQPLSINFIKKKATVLSYRKAVYAEHDETYAQAFGAKPVWASRGIKDAEAQPVEEPSRAPLSGPHVIAEALGKEAISTKANEAKGQDEKDGYLFKQREELDEMETPQINLADGTVKFAASSEEKSAVVKVSMSGSKVNSSKVECSASVDASNVLGKAVLPGIVDNLSCSSEPEVERTINFKHDPVNLEKNKLDEGYQQSPSLPTTVKELHGQKQVHDDRKGVKKEKALKCTASGEKKVRLEKSASEKKKRKKELGTECTTGEFSVEKSASGEKKKKKRKKELGAECTTGELSVEKSASGEKKSSLEKSASGEKKRKKRKEELGTESTTGELSIEISAPGEEKKKKRKKELGTENIHKHAATEKSGTVVREVAENSVQVEKKKKKKKKKRMKEFETETCSNHMQKHAAAEKSGARGVNIAERSVQVGSADVENFQVACPEKVDSVSSSVLPDSAGMQPMKRAVNFEPELPQLLSGLKSLSSNPFHGVKRNNFAVTQQAVLRFRSLVFQKSSVPLPALETHSDEAAAATTFPESNAVTDDSRGKNIMNLPSLKAPKPHDKPDESTKSGSKRSPSDRIEGVAAKKLKKISELKSLAAEKKGVQNTEEEKLKRPSDLKTLAAKKGVQKTEEASKGAGKERVAPPPPKSVKADSAKKMEPPAKAANPATLVMKFPPHTNLPSGSELKFRLARFGPLDHSGTRIFYKTSMCRVVFLHKPAAEAALKHLRGKNSLFGNVNIRCHLREDPAPESEPSKVGTDGTSMENPQAKDSAFGQRLPDASAYQPRQQPAVPLKSCLKKSGAGDETGPITAGIGDSRMTPRVKFMLGEQLMVAIKNNNGIFPDGESSSSHAIDFCSKKFQNVVLPPPPPPSSHIVHLPSAQSAIAKNNLHNSEVGLGSNRHFNNPAGPFAAMDTPTSSFDAPIAASINIAPQMMGLLRKCSEVVNNVKGIYGYMPYHPL